MMIDWNKYIGQYPCYESIPDFRSFNDVASCMSLIPQQLDTPALKDIRTFLEKYHRHPIYHGEAYERNKEEHVYLKDLLKSKIKSEGKPWAYEKDPKSSLNSVKSRIRWGLNDSPYNLISACNQKIKWKKIPRTESSYTQDWDDIVDADGENLCKVNKEMAFKARDLGDALDKEEWDELTMLSTIRGYVHANWIKENAWDLSDKELKDLDIDEELGVK